MSEETYFCDWCYSNHPKLSPGGVKNLYDIICGRGHIGVADVRHMEHATNSNFKDTADFHRKVSSFLARKNNAGEELREARKKKGWTLDTMGFYLGVSKQFVHQMEAGRKPLIDKALEFIGKKPISPYGEPQNG